jgi:hypothetical protein
MKFPFAAPGRRGALAALAVVGITLASCGGDDDDADTTTLASEPAGPTSSAATSAPAGTETGTAPAGTGDTGDATEEDYVAAGAATLDLGDPEVDRCITQATIDAIGFENVQASGRSPEELFDEGLTAAGLTVAEGEAASLQDAIAGCGDLIALFARSEEATETEVACAEEHLDNDIMAAVFVSTLTATAPTPELQGVFEEMQACIDAG